MTRNQIIALVALLGAILVVVFTFGLYPKPATPPIETNNQQVKNPEPGVKVLGGNLSKDGTVVIAPTQALDITFNKPMVRDDARIILDPKVDYKVEISSDHKTIKIIPEKAFDLGKDYTLTIKSGYGTDTGEKLDTDLTFKFKTISYTGV